MNLRTLDDRTWVSGQIRPEDVAGAAAAGVALIVNNRPDGEEPGQPASADIEAAARAVGIDYRYIPLAGGIAPEQTSEMASILDEASGHVLAFCRSGTRSTWLWALAQSQRGVDGETLLAQAEAAGYDLNPLRSYLAAR